MTLTMKSLHGELLSLRRFVRVAIAGFALIAVGAFVTMGVFVINANRSVEEIKQTRSTSRVIACISDRENALKVNALNDRTQDLLEQTFNAPRTTPRSDEAQATVDAYLRDQFAQFDAVKVEVRKCDASSIAAYYRGPR